jgi:heme exporter protein D
LEHDVELGPHAAFIIAAYAAGGLVVLILIGWVVADYRAQLRTLAELEQQGVTRRSAAPERDAA